MEDHYAILGITHTASRERVKKAYRKLARKHHPDLNRDNPDAAGKFKRVQAAFDVLHDPCRRSRYDAQWLEWLGRVVPSEDYYSILDVRRDATPEAIVAAYREFLRGQARKESRDRERLKDVRLAFEVLSNVKLRARYNRTTLSFKTTRNFGAGEGKESGQQSAGRRVRRDARRSRRSWVLRTYAPLTHTFAPLVAVATIIAGALLLAFLGLMTAPAGEFESADEMAGRQLVGAGGFFLLTLLFFMLMAAIRAANDD